MAEHTITLTADEETALTEMGITDLETYVKSVCGAHISQKLKEDFDALSDEDKRTALGQ